MIHPEKNLFEMDHVFDIKRYRKNMRRNSLPSKKFTQLLVIACLILAGCNRGTSPANVAASPSGAVSQPSPSTTAATPTAVLPATEASPAAATNSPSSGSLPAPGVLDTPWNDRSIYTDNLINSEQSILEKLPGASVYHIYLSISSDMLTLNGKEEVAYTNRTAAPLNEICFRLFPNLYGSLMNVSNLQVNNQKVDGVLEQENTALRVPLYQALPPGQPVVLRLDFTVNVPTDGGGNYNTFVFTEDVLALAQFYPLIPAYDSAGWHTEIPPNYGDVTYTDMSFYEVRITALAAVTIVSSGALLHEQKSGDQQTITLAGGPVRDFYIAASDQYSVTSQKVGETTVNIFSAPDRKDSADFTLKTTEKAFASYSRHFGAYPYTVFNIVTTPNNALGIEYPQVVALNQDLFDPNANFGNIPTSVLLEATSAHEIAHQWFYGIVGDDQVNQPWLDEAMAQYDTYLYYLDSYGPDAALSYSQDWQRRWDRVDDADTPIGLPVKDYTPQSYGAIVYGRGPIFIETLSEQMGQDKFAAFLKDYYQTYQWGIATTDGFEKLASKDCGCDLSGLFQEWVQ